MPTKGGRPIEAHTLSDAGAYVAVLAAALGRVSLTVERRAGGKDGTGKGVKIHPFFMWLIAIPLFLVQISCVFSLRFDLDVLKRVDDNAADQSPALLELTRTLKLLMVLILQVTQFSEIAQTLRFLVFVLNPLTWVEVAHPTRDQWLSSGSQEWQKIFFHPAFLVPWPILALFMKFIIGYLVCVDSVSLIMSADHVTDAIFNSLALTFIIDLNRAWKLVTSIVFHLKLDDDSLLHTPWEQVLEDATPETADRKVWNRRAQWIGSCVCGVLGGAIGQQIFWMYKKNIMVWAPGGLASLLVCSVGGYNWIKVTSFDSRQFLESRFGEHDLFFWLRRGIGAKTIEGIIAGCLLILIYMQQSMVVLFAHKTNVLPVARDVCTQYRWLHAEAEGLQVPAMLFRLFEKTIPVNTVAASDDLYNKKLNNITNNQTFRPSTNVVLPDGTIRIVNQTLGCHLTELHPYGDFYRMTMTDRWDLIWDNPWTMFWGAVLLIVVLLGSHTGSMIHARFFSITEGEDTSSRAEMRRSMTQMEKRIDELERKIEEGSKTKEEGSKTK